MSGLDPCGGCQGLGAHTRACRDPLGHLADQIEGLGDQIGSNAPELANQAYRIAGTLRRHGTHTDHERDGFIRDLARAHGRPEAAERIAWGLPPISENSDPAVLGYTTTKARPQQAGLTRAQEEPLDVEDLTPHLERHADYAARFAHGYQEDT